MTDRMTKKCRVRALCLALAGIMAASAPQAVFATSISGMEKEKKEAQKALDEANADAKKAEQQKNAAQSEVKSLTAELTDLISEISLLESDIAAKDEQIIQAQADYDAAKEKEESQSEYMKMRIQFMYEKGDTEFLDVLLRVSSIEEFLNKSEYIESIYEYDKKMMEEYRDTKLAVEAYKNQLEEDKAEMEGMQLEYEGQKANLETTIAKKRTEVSNFDAQLEQAKKDAASYTKTIAKKNEQIRAAEEEARRKAEEEARRKAEEEASKAAESAAAAQNQTSQNSGGTLTDGSPGGSDSSTGSRTTNTTAPTQASSTSSGGSSSGPGGSSSGSTSKSSSPTKSSGGSAQGRAVADYGLQFVGNPYVYGGTSLTNGADCSGFVQSVYKNFGYSLPRTSYEQRSVGTGVEYSNAQPGDLICYAGHVGIYIGNGKIVHASNPSSGIKVSSATYRTILAVRRVVQ